jgi:predicted transcriptional regulator
MMERQDLVSLTTDVVATYVANNKVPLNAVAKLVRDVHQTLSSLGEEQQEPEKREPAVSVRSSVKPEYLVCLECGKKQKTLKRHIKVAHGLTPDEYRQQYGLPASYPMVATEYAEKRRDLAKSFGLGRKKGEKAGSKRKTNGNTEAAASKGAGNGKSAS